MKFRFARTSLSLQILLLVVLFLSALVGIRQGSSKSAENTTH
jgi:hypothetical protein